MLVLVHSAPVSLERDHGRPPGLGVLMCPKVVYPDAPGRFPWAADNRAFSGWDESRYVRMLARITAWPGCLFVVAPDVVGDAEETTKRFFAWRDRVRATKQPIAYAGQDGLVEPPWDDFDVFFVGGSTEWKMGDAAAAFAREAKRRGKWLHMGRVNTHRRIRYAQSLGVDSIDGTNFSMYRRVKLPAALRMNAAGRQLALVQPVAEEAGEQPIGAESSEPR